MAYTPGYYMPNGMYGGQSYPMNGMQTVSYGGVPQPMPTQQASSGIIWVDGEVGAKAFQMPAGTNGPVALWDTNDQVIYLKSMNQMGMPNPLQKIRYQMEEVPQMLPAGQQTSGNTAPDMSGYVTKDDINALRNEIREMLNQHMNSNQNGSQNSNMNGNINSAGKGGNR